jgi:hypothetical protein
MPPKKPEVKKEEDLSDLSSLPPLNQFTFQLFMNFKLKDNQDELQKYIIDNLNQERIKMISREEIILHGKEKGIISDSPPEEGPPLTENEQLCKSAADKLFQLQVAGRRTKKEKW